MYVSSFLGCFTSRIIKTSLTNAIVIDVDFTAKYCALALARLLYFYVISRGSSPSMKASLAAAAFGGVYPFVIFPCNFISRGHVPSSSPQLAARAHRESTVITVQSCCFSFIRVRYSKSALASLRPSRFNTSAGGYMNSTAW